MPTSAVKAVSSADPAACLGIADLSHLPRCGLKGPGTSAWLGNLGLPLPTTPSSWLNLADGTLIARLGNTEYLIEGNAALIDSIMQTPRTAGVYPVLRQDTSLAVCGSRVNELLLQVCNVDFRILAADTSQLVLTSMAGVGVTVLRTGSSSQPVYRVWCDGTYGLYLHETLAGIAEELGGGFISADFLP
jgi:sarcosine oxidase subunit gamma